MSCWAGQDEQKGLNPAWSGGGECGVLSCLPCPWLSGWPPCAAAHRGTRHHRAIEMATIWRPLCQSRLYTWFLGMAKPRGQAEGALHRVCSTRHCSPHPPPLALPSTCHALCHPHHRDILPAARSCHLHPPHHQGVPRDTSSRSPRPPAHPVSPPLLARLACYS